MLRLKVCCHSHLFEISNDLVKLSLHCLLDVRDAGRDLSLCVCADVDEGATVIVSATATWWQPQLEVLPGREGIVATGTPGI